MGTVNSRDGKLYLDFRYKGLRCREQTKLTDTPANRQKLAKVLAMLEQQIKTGTFDYGHHFPDSPRIEHFRKVELLGRLTIPSYERGVARLLRYDRHP